MGAFTFNTSQRLVFEEGSSAALAQHAASFLGARPLIVTDKGIVSSGLLAGPLKSLSGDGRDLAVFDGITADPDLGVLNGALEAARTFKPTAIVGFGGGSSLDVSKLVALLASSSEPLDGIWGVGNIKGPRLPLILVPTTAGTGSEVTPISIITISEDEKRGAVSPVLLPDLAVLDPLLTIGLPAPTTAATGVDAMVHAIESFTSRSPNNNPVSRTLAVEALKLLGQHIESAVTRPEDRAARGGMLLGSMLAGMAFANSPVAAVHALAYPIGSSFHVPHGVSTALMLPHVIRFNAEEAQTGYAELAPHVFPELSSVSKPLERTNLFADRLQDLIKRLGLAPSLRDAGITASDLQKMAADAMKQTRLLVNNPRPVTETNALAIYEAAL
ncbi:iron-containing alcohol dehydrogenase [Roseibium sp. RKSG952]|uniref:iron-containing alcohol dehydrogenase n=1 Tax=Roseibium sp. RKSG952 TaxID=2529384 RepID=UPI0034CD4620